MISDRWYRLAAVVLMAVMLVALAPALPRAQAAGGVLAYGDVVSGSITSQDYYELWQFAGTKGDRVQILMEGDGNLDPYLGVLDAASEEVLAEDDDSGGNSNALIEMTLPSTGDFVIIATRYNLDEGTSEGKYQLSLGGNATTTNVSNTTTTTSEPVEVSPGVFYISDIALDTPVSGSISADSYAQLYSIDVAAGTDLMVAMFADASNLDPYLIFMTENGDVLAEDDDSGASLEGADKTDSFLELTVADAGTYYVVATRAGVDTGKTTGDYVLVAVQPAAQEPVSDTTESDLPAGVEAMGMVEIGSTSQGEITNDSFLHIYAFDGQAGDQITITMTGSGDLDAYLGLMDANQDVIAEDDDSAGGLNAQISISLPESGTYLVLATRNGIDQGSTTGSYTLQISSGAPEPSAGQTGLGGFGGLPGRAVETGEGTFYLRGLGATDNPEKQAPIGQFLSENSLPGRGSLASELEAAVGVGPAGLSVEDFK